MKTFLPLANPSVVSLASLAVLFFLAGRLPVEARNPIRQTFFTSYPEAVGTQLDSLPGKGGHCGVCHYDFNGGGTRNPYGQAIESAGFALNQETGRSNAISSVRHLDSDGDGFSNVTEITNTTDYSNTPTFPGLSAGNTNLVSNMSVLLIQNYLTPATASDSTPPSVTVISPNGGETLTANQTTAVTWTATDASGIAYVSIHLSLDDGATFAPLALSLAHTGGFSWIPANRPTTAARIKIVAVDNANNTGEDMSNAAFSIVSPPGGRVATTLRDFDMPGSQPFESGAALEASTDCASCHGNFNAATEPYFTWQGSMMAHAGRDPLFLANLAIANQDAPESGDLCLRCHFPRGWHQGRSVPTDGSSMLAADTDGVSCALCHRMVDPVYTDGVSPLEDLNILLALSFPGTNHGNGMVVLDPTGERRGPFDDTVSPHSVLASPFHRSAAFCGSCHDVSNPAFERNAEGNYEPNALDRTATDFSPHTILPVERTYSEWLNSEYNTAAGVYAPQFAGNRAGGRVSTCQDCHMRAVTGYGCDPNTNPGAPLRENLPLHDLTGGSTWLPGLLTNLYPSEVNAAAIAAGIERAAELLKNAATLAVADAPGSLKVTVTNECGHKLPTGYPEGRRIWLNVKFFDENMNPLGESGAYDFDTGILTRDSEAKIYEIHPGIDTNLALALGLSPGPSFHFVLNNVVYSDNRIPPRGFANASYAAFGGAPVDYTYADGQYWDETLYARPEGATRAEVRLYYQSTSKEFIEFLRDENRSNTAGQEMYDLWRDNGMCPPTLMAESVWVTPFQLGHVGFTEGRLRFEFLARPGTTYSIEFTDGLEGGGAWQPFQAGGSFVATDSAGVFEDDFTAKTSGGPSVTGSRFYRFKYAASP